MILLKYGAIKADSTVDGHADWITCSSMQFGVGRAISSSGGGKSRDTSNPSFSEVTITKTTDCASADLFFESCGGSSGGKAEIHFIQTAKGASQVFLKIELEEALVSGYSVSSGGDRPSESISLNYTKITYQYDDFSGKEVKTGDVKKWNLMGNASY